MPMAGQVLMLAILSGPCALAVLIPWRSFSTPLVVMRRGDIGRLALFLVSGSCWSSSQVKTDWNCSTNIWASSLLSLTHVKKLRSVLILKVYYNEIRSLLHRILRIGFHGNPAVYKFPSNRTICVSISWHGKTRLLYQKTK